MKFGVWCSLVRQKQAIHESFLHKNCIFSPICKCFLPQKFPAIRLTSSPGYSQILSCSRGEKSGSLGTRLLYGTIEICHPFHSQTCDGCKSDFAGDAHRNRYHFCAGRIVHKFCSACAQVQDRPCPACQAPLRVCYTNCSTVQSN